MAPWSGAVQTRGSRAYYASKSQRLNPGFSVTEYMASGQLFSLSVVCLLHQYRESTRNNCRGVIRGLRRCVEFRRMLIAICLYYQPCLGEFEFSCRRSYEKQHVCFSRKKKFHLVQTRKLDLEKQPQIKKPEQWLTLIISIWEVETEEIIITLRPATVLHQDRWNNMIDFRVRITGFNSCLNQVPATPAQAITSQIRPFLSQKCQQERCLHYACS